MSEYVERRGERKKNDRKEYLRREELKNSMDLMWNGKTIMEIFSVLVIWRMEIQKAEKKVLWQQQLKLGQEHEKGNHYMRFFRLSINVLFQIKNDGNFNELYISHLKQIKLREREWRKNKAVKINDSSALLIPLVLSVALSTPHFRLHKSFSRW